MTTSTPPPTPANLFALHHVDGPPRPDSPAKIAAILERDLPFGNVGLYGTGYVSGTVAMQAARAVATHACLRLVDEKDTTVFFEKMSRDPRISKGKGERVPWRLRIERFDSARVSFGEVEFVGDDEAKYIDNPLTRAEMVLPADNGLPREYILGAVMTAHSATE